MSFTGIFDGFPARLGEDVSFAGPEGKSDESRPGRIVWQPVSAQHLPPRRIGGGPGDEGPILTRQWMIAVEIWAANLDAAVVLTNKFLAVAHDLLSQHSYRPGDEQWELGGKTSKGAICRMGFVLQTPVLRTAVATVPVTSINPTLRYGETVV